MPHSHNEDTRISLGYDSLQDSSLSFELLTMASVLQSDCNSCFLCIYANVCWDITDSGLIVLLLALKKKKNWIKVSSKMDSGKTTVQW